MPTSARLEAVRNYRQATLSQELGAKGLKLGQPVFFRIFKEENTIEAWVRNTKTNRYDLFNTYSICNFSGKLGPKLKQGDKQAPEGFYTIAPKQMNPKSQYHLAFNIGYPNAFDKAHGHTGNALMVHGGCASSGCFALTDQTVEDVYLLADNALRKGYTKVEFGGHVLPDHLSRAVGASTDLKAVPIHIFPFRMTEDNMKAHEDNKWAAFWNNLKDGYDAFEETHIPPVVEVEQADDARYVFYALNPPEQQASLF